MACVLPTCIESRQRSLLALVLILVSLPHSNSALGQSSASNAAGVTASQADDGTRRVTLTRSVEPSFHIEPIVQRFEARRGAVIPFTFEIASTGKDMNVDVQAVNLRQEETGIIMHDTSSNAESPVQFTSDTEFALAPGEKFEIQGTVTVPLARTNFLSYGILVRDNGVSSDSDDSVSSAEAVQAAVNFVTQYVLRIDIETGVREISEMSRLELRDGEVSTQQGLPVAGVYLHNPTDFAFEMQVRGKPQTASNKRQHPFFLTMQSRASLKDEERTLIRIMPRATLKLVAPLDMLDIGNLNSIDVAVTNGRREVVEETFELNTPVSRFPALESRIASLPNGVSLEPAQIEIGQIAGVDRTCNLQFRNSGEQNQGFQLELVGLNGQPLEGVRISSDEFSMKAGRTKTVRLSIASARDKNTPRYGILNVYRSQSGQPLAQLPVALLYAAPETPNVTVSEMTLAERAGTRVFAVTATNNGKGYVPIHGNMALSSKQGWTVQMAAGYGVWLKPGETRSLEFIPDRPLEDSTYQIAYEIRTTDDADPVTRSLVVDLGALDAQADPKAADIKEQVDSAADAT